jgi:hypothetical protein
MSWTPTDDQVEKAARDLLIRERGNELPWERWHTVVHQGYLDTARAVLVAVGPMIAAQAWDEGAEAQARAYGMDKDTGPNPYSEKEAGR